MNNSASASRRTWNRVMNALVWASAVLVIVLVAGILGMVLVRGIPHISWKFLTTTASVLKGTDGMVNVATWTADGHAFAIDVNGKGMAADAVTALVKQMG